MRLSVTIIAAISWAGLVSASNIPTSTITSNTVTPVGSIRNGEPFLWPAVVRVATRIFKRETNAMKLKRGLPLEQPKRLYKPNYRRALAAPSQGATGDSIYEFVGCNTGDDTASSTRTVTGTVQEMVDQCAAFQAADTTAQTTTFGVYASEGLCYTGIDYPAMNPIDCADAKATIADYNLQ